MPHDAVDVTVQGSWAGATRTPGDTAVLNDGNGVYPVHTILLHTGRVLMFSGGWEGSDLLHRSWTFDPVTWDPAAPTAGVIGRWFLPEFDDDPVANSPPPTGTHDPDIDLFCSHHVQIEDGRILVVDHGNHRCQLFTRQGEFLDAFGARLYVEAARRGGAEWLEEQR
jgi:hypothetical protein